MPLQFDLSLDGPMYSHPSHQGFFVYFKRIDSGSYKKWVAKNSRLNSDNFDLSQDPPVLKPETLSADQADWILNQLNLFCADMCTRVEGAGVEWGDLNQEQKILFFEQLQTQLPDFTPWMQAYIHGGEKKSSGVDEGKGSKIRSKGLRNVPK